MKKIIFVFLFAVSTLIAQTYSGGSGTPGDPYQVANKNDLKYLSEHSSDWAKSFIQTADINFSSSDFQSGGDFYNGGAGFIPIGNSSTKFTGNYNGNGHSINGIFINRAGTHYIGLFGYIGNSYNSSTIENLSVTNVDITGEDNTAGVVGYSTKSTVQNCFSSGNVSGHYQVGGVVGYNNNAIINKSSSTCTINGIHWVGGVAGRNENNTAEITKCYSTGNVNGEQYIGGLVGNNKSGAVINNCYSTGSVTRTSGTNVDIGAFCGYNNSTIEYCYSLGSVFEAPGVVWDEGPGGKDKGFIGYINNGVYNYNFWNKDISNQDGVLVTTSGDSVATSITTVKMRYHSSFTASYWDFIIETANGTDDIWDMDQEKTINNGFPILSWQTGADNILAYSGGDGSSDHPYQIGNLNDLSDLTQRSLDWASNFIQTADIDAAPTQYWDDADDDSDGDLFNDANDLNSSGNNEGFLPIANDITRFTGFYNGNNKSISGIIINRSIEDYVGFFGNTEEATIQNLSILNVNIIGHNYVGGLVGWNYSSTIDSCYSNGNISAGNFAGGLVGKNYHSHPISASYSDCTVSGESSVGGLVGGSNFSTIQTSYSTGTVSGTSEVGNFIGVIHSSVISNSYCTGSVTRNSGTETYFGAFCGENDNSTIEYCYSSASVYSSPGTDWNVGGNADKGFVGRNLKTVTYTANFFDSEVSNQSSATGADAKTTSEMQDFNTFINSGWDFIIETTNGNNDYWDMDQLEVVNNGYPILSWQDGSDGVLPVELSSFTATAQNKGILLNWTTATEVNNYGFEIERASSSTTPRQDDWEKIGFVEGHGNSNSPKKYSYIDSDKLSGTVKYRLKQIDTDGSFEYSDVVEVDVALPQEYKLEQNYPNPFNPGTTISFTLPKKSDVKLVVFNSLGEKVSELINGNKEAGNYKVKFDASNLSSGIYFYRISAGNFVDVKKMILLK